MQNQIPKSNNGNASADEPIEKLRKIAKTVYVLQLLGFLCGITYPIGTYMGYVYLPDAEGTWLASHYHWQQRTFWFALFVALLALAFLHYLKYVTLIILIVDAAWIIYRIIKGWVYLNRRQEILGVIF